MTWLFTVSDWSSVARLSPDLLRDIQSTFANHNWGPDDQGVPTAWNDLITLNEPFHDPVALRWFPYSDVALSMADALRQLQFPNAADIIIGPFGPFENGEKCTLEMPLDHVYSRLFVASAWFLGQFESYLWQGNREEMERDFAQIHDTIDCTVPWFLAAIEKRVQAVDKTLAHFVHIQF